MTNTNGTMVIAGSLSSANEYISGFATHLCVGSPVDNTALRNSVQIVAPGAAFYNFYSSFVMPGIELWGIFTATSLDPVDKTTLWTVVPYVPVYEGWGVRVAALQG